MLSKLPVSRRLAGGLVIVLVACAGVAALALRSPEHVARDWRAELSKLVPEDQGDHMVHVLADGRRAVLTLDPQMQRVAERVLSDANAAFGAAVLLSVDDGRVLAMAGRARAKPEHDDVTLALKAWAPAASVFKLVTAAALLEAGVKPDTRVCYHGGLRSVEADNLEDHPELDASCRSFAYGLAKSQNAIIGRLVNDHLDPARLEATARAFGFGAAPAFELPTAVSQLEVPAEPLELARVAAGFWHTTLSPLHGAVLAATIARGGEAPPVRVVDRIVDRAGLVERPEVAPARRVIPEAVAGALAGMMVGTTERGSARVAFRDKHTNRRLLPWRVAGKTGTLAGRNPFIAYSWFVGFAPAERPQVAFAVLLGNDDYSVKAAEVSRRMLAGWHSRTQDANVVATR